MTRPARAARYVRPLKITWARMKPKMEVRKFSSTSLTLIWDASSKKDRNDFFMELMAMVIKYRATMKMMNTMNRFGTTAARLSMERDRELRPLISALTPASAAFWIVTTASAGMLSKAVCARASKSWMIVLACSMNFGRL